MERESGGRGGEFLWFRRSFRFASDRLGGRRRSLSIIKLSSPFSSSSPPPPLAHRLCPQHGLTEIPQPRRRRRLPLRDAAVRGARCRQGQCGGVRRQGVGRGELGSHCAWRKSPARALRERIRRGRALFLSLDCAPVLERKQRGKGKGSLKKNAGKAKARIGFGKSKERERKKWRA